MIIPNIWKNKKCSKPLTRLWPVDIHKTSEFQEDHGSNSFNGYSGYSFRYPISQDRQSGPLTAIFRKSSMVYMTKQRSEKIANSSVPADTMHLEKVRSCESICFKPMSQERGWKPHNALRYELLRYLEKLFVDICSLATSLFRPQRPQIWLRWGEMYI